ncbi:hypothetical protein AUP68_11137 [Ilyonectria robusta]
MAVFPLASHPLIASNTAPPAPSPGCPRCLAGRWRPQLSPRLQISLCPQQAVGLSRVMSLRWLCMCKTPPPERQLH